MLASDIHLGHGILGSLSYMAFQAEKHLVEFVHTRGVNSTLWFVSSCHCDVSEQRVGKRHAVAHPYTAFPPFR